MKGEGDGRKKGRESEGSHHGRHRIHWLVSGYGPPEEGERGRRRRPQLRPPRIEGFKDEFEKNKDRLTFIQGDLSLSEHVHQWFDEFRPQSVYHLGALLSAGAETNPTQGFLTDLQGSWHVLEAARLQRQR